eukprot:CAMPEP_0119418392 /NCGR_PEP_ID=MMETSP1335-20130426/18145_1 /TAXON_ID=259385 /ORGANISM="Chrysoculter rhomboideus, Strain RCC1486" /LENGTH=96 /DNA_ID=CAMNT_0007443635 /DNA_START=225 /DNA_END=517 /DNA_ORIENTATION=-
MPSSLCGLHRVGRSSPLTRHAKLNELPHSTGLMSLADAPETESEIENERPEVRVRLRHSALAALPEADVHHQGSADMTPGGKVVCIEDDGASGHAI